MIKEFREIEKGTVLGKPVVTPIKPDSLYFNDKRKVLEIVNMIKEKICGNKMGRT